METSKEQHFLSLMHEFRFGMLTTHADDGELHGRPMAIAKVDDDGDVWLVSDVHSDKVEELARDAHVGVGMQEGQKFIALTGKAEVVRDHEKIQAIWNEAWKVWFPNGPEDPGLVLIKIKPTHGEYWDNGGVNAVKYLYKAAKAYVQGKRPEVGDLQGKVELNN